MSVIKRSFLYLIGQLGSRFIQVIIIPIYAFYLTTNQVGIYDFQLSLAQFLSPILFLAIWEGILRFALPAKMGEKKTILGTALIFSLLVSSISIFLIPFVYVYLYPNNPEMSLFGIAFVTTSVVTLMQYVARSLNKSIIFVKQGVYSAIINLFSIGIFVIVVNLEMTGLIFSYIISNVFSIYYIFRKCQLINLVKTKYYSNDVLLKLIKYSFPLVFNLILLWLLQGFSRWYLVTFQSTSMSGLFSFAFKFSAILAALGNVLSLSLIEDAVITKDDNNFIDKFSKNMNMVFKIFIDLGTILLPVIGIFYLRIEGTAFFSSWIAVPFLLLGTIFQIMSTNIGNLLNVHTLTKYLFYSSLVSACVNVFGCLVLGHFFKLTGVSVSYLLSCLSILLVRYFLTMKIEKWSLGFGMIVHHIILYVIVWIACLTLNIYIMLFSILLVSFIHIITYKNEFKTIRKYIFKKEK
ncbi:lipopolysaccharide biosynthesis protein [Enterococcus casseliflavus]|uniref:lipopolysaccharide biosynthesis protein n=1 Tax=Enterococcus casseliflavus TaxID=37734 RepID=UPI00115871F5|nr:oligosaccharide flippase family protein [Enterococcus casseliflavus]